MKKLFEIDENEKRRILEMHENATKRNYLSEQGTPQTTQPPQQLPYVTSEGTMINGKKYTIENIKNEASLNQFLQWGMAKGAAEETSSPKTAKIGPSKARAKAAGVSDEILDKINEDDFRDGGKTPEAIAAIEKIDSMYSALDLIAQNYTISELCTDSPQVKSGIDRYALEIAKNRVGKYYLNWCNEPEPGSQAKAKRDATKAAIKARQDAQNLQQDRSKF